MFKLFKSMKWFELVTGILALVLGVVMIFTPLTSLAVLAIFIAIDMLLSGLSEIFAFFGERGRRSGWLLGGGILSVLFAVWAFFGSGMAVLVTVLPFIFAVWVMSSGVIRVVGAVTMRSEGFKLWAPMLAVGLLSAAVGFLLLFNPVFSAVAVSILLAVVLISYGVNNILIFFRLRDAGDNAANKL